MLLDDGERLAANAFNVALSPFCVYFSNSSSALMRADLLLGIGLSKSFSCAVQIVDHALMLLVERGRQLNVDLVALDDTLEFGGGLRVRLDHVLAKLLDGV